MQLLFELPLTNNLREWWTLVMSGSSWISSITSPSVMVTSLGLRPATSSNLKPAPLVSCTIDLFRAAHLRVLMCDQIMFVFSKLISAITQPMFWLALWWFAALLMLNRWRRSSVRMLWGCLVMLGLIGFQALPNALLRSLESRYAAQPQKVADSHVGLIVLGGATGHSDIYKAHGQVPLGDAAERMTVPVALMRQHPKLQLVFSGGEGRLLVTGVTEAELAKAFFQEQGVDMARVLLEGGSRNTRENAQQVAELLGERCKEPWLLVTSAWHIPRAMAEFESVGCHVTAYPVDFRTGDTTALTEYSFANSLVSWQMALHEWVGLMVYGLSSNSRQDKTSIR